ncbi:MAG: shikimate kinase [Candidatus Omnitrophica bacterium]|nr:shikimate kinase [Candidatus Omnitrophota bacterium]
MGTGKSVVGKLLADRLGRPYLDLDRKIEKTAGRTVAQIFEGEGEAGFRKRERDAVREAAGLKGHVVATGGGVMMDDENVRLLKGSGWLVCLTASPDVILQRTTATLQNRPLLSGGEPRERVEALLKLRAPYYAQADAAVDTSNRPVKEIVEEIVKWLAEKS